MSDELMETWETVHDMSLKLAGMIEAGSRQRGEQFDYMVVIPRGSYYPANIISRELGFESIDLLHACLGSYNLGETRRKADFKLGQMPDVSEVKGKNLLIVEEVCDTGHTLSFLTKWLYDADASLVRSGVLHYKPSRNETGFKPDWYVSQTDKWIVYPWETSEQRGATSQVHRKS